MLTGVRSTMTCLEIYFTNGSCRELEFSTELCAKEFIAVLIDDGWAFDNNNCLYNAQNIQYIRKREE